MHTLAFLWFAWVWLWHLTPAAEGLPGAHGFGWFPRYLTFYSFTLQTAALGLAAADDWSTAIWGGGSHRSPRHAALSAWADDLSCALFGLAHVVTLMFFAIQSATHNKGMSEAEDKSERPWWLGASTHKLNAVAAWADMISSRRTFSQSSRRLSTLLVSFYLFYMQLCRQMNGQYPYPFMRWLPEPYGFLATAITGLTLFAVAFRLGAAVNCRVTALTASIKRHVDRGSRGVGAGGALNEAVGGGSPDGGASEDADAAPCDFPSSGRSYSLVARQGFAGDAAPEAARK